MFKEYKGFQIEFWEKSEKWNARKDGEEMFTDASFKSIKEKIDMYFKKEVPRLKFYKKSNSKYEIWEITSFGDSQAWASKGRSREKLYSSEKIISVNPSNTELIKEITNLTVEYNKLEKNIELLTDKLTGISVQEYIDNINNKKGG